VGAYTAHGPEAEDPASRDQGHSDLEKIGKHSDPGHAHSHSGDSKQVLLMMDENAMAQLVGVGILEFGVILHRHVSLFL
jgi:zinc transporter 1/2/3